MRRVALLVETSLGYGRGVLRGVAEYVKAHERWSVFLEQRELAAASPDWIARFEGDGILCRRLTPAVRAAGVPTVLLDDQDEPRGDVPAILNDSLAVGQMAAEHLIDRGFRSLGYYGPPERYWSRRRCRGVRDAAAEADGAAAADRVDAFFVSDEALEKDGWNTHQDRLAKWIASRPRPFGLVCGNDVFGVRALDACRRAELSVPEQVAVVGADDDRELCELCDPPLSSVSFDSERVGYEAASLLDAMMSGAVPTQRLQMFPPRGVVTRHSSDTLAVDDPMVANALATIRRRACEPLSVGGLVDTLGVSRRTFEIRFRESTGHSPKEEIQRVRAAAAARLLSGGGLSVTDVSLRTGFARPSQFAAFFRQRFGVSPSEYQGEN